MIIIYRYKNEVDSLMIENAILRYKVKSLREVHKAP